MLIRWSEQMSVGNELIDSQHKVLIGLVNDLDRAMREGHGNEAVGEVLEGLTQYTMKHFEEEEDLFMASDYPDKEKHLTKHRLLLERVVELKEQHQAGTRFISMEVLHFLQNWLTEHIMKTDKTYSAYL